MPDEPSDEELAFRAGRGDRRAFPQLYLRHKHSIFGRITRLIGPGADREDVLQEVVVQLLRALPSFRGESSFKTYLFQIVSHVVLDHLRRRKRRPVIHDEAALAELAATLPDPAEHAHARAQLRLLFSKLELIEPKRRVVFVLIAVEGLSYEEAADQLGVSLGAVRQRLSLARMELAPLVEAEPSALPIAWRPA